MDHLSRLIVALYLFLCGAAYAASCPSNYWASAQYGTVSSWSGPLSSNDLAARTAACKALNAAWQATSQFTTTNGFYVSQCGYWQNGTWNLVGGTSVQVSVTKWFLAPSGQWQQTDPGTCDEVTCPDNKDYDSSTNTCNCKTIGSAGRFMVSGDEYTGCNNGCSMVLKSGWYDKTNNVTWGNWSQPGTACAVSDKTVISNSDPKVEAAKSCDAGTCPGTIGGQSVCVPCDKAKQTETATSGASTSTTASGATSSTTTTQSDSETARTDCKDGTCTTTTTSTTIGSNGDKVDKTSTKTEPQSDYCTQNPKAAVCKGTESSWGGTCAAFTCDGDAVTCAIAQASWKSACALDIDPSDSKVTAGNSALGAGDRPPGHPALNPDTSSFSANLDTSNPYGSECPTDMPLQVLGQQFEIPLSTACGSLRFMGQIAVAFALLAAAYIVFGGVKG